MTNCTPTILGIIPCTKAKIWDMYPNLGPMLAKEVYTNPFHALAKKYISLFTKEWVILSAKYGFLSPNDTLPKTYDITFDRPDDPYITIEALQSQIISKQLYTYTDIMVICNSRYIDKIRQAFINYPVKFHTPFENIEDDLEGILRLNKCIREQGKIYDVTVG